MKQEDKELLLKDLSARLPYDPIVKVGENNHPFRLSKRLRWVLEYGNSKSIEDLLDNLKPYLRSMEDMTDEEKELVYSPTGYWNNPVALIDMFNSHHLDYRSMIVKGLAIRVTPDNNPYE